MPLFIFNHHSRTITQETSNHTNIMKFRNSLLALAIAILGTLFVSCSTFSNEGRFERGGSPSSGDGTHAAVPAGGDSGETSKGYADSHSHVFKQY